MRNDLIHSYFREREFHWVTLEGRMTMVQELTDARVLFTATDDLLDRAVAPLMQKYGFTQERMEKAIADRLATVRLSAEDLDDDA